MKIFLITLLSISLFATATLTKIRTFTQSDGSTFKGRLQGDASLHWIEAEDGSILLFNKKTANFEYAEVKESDILLSGEVYKGSSLRSLHVKHNSINRDTLIKLWEKRHQ